MNKFSSLVQDDNDFFCESCSSIHTSKAQCQQRDDERSDGCMTNPETKVSSHRRSDPSKQCAHQVSYLAVSGGDSKGVHHVSGSGWRRVSEIMDSGSSESVAQENIARIIPLVETEASREGQTYHTADGGVIKYKGGKDCDDVFRDR